MRRIVASSVFSMAVALLASLTGCTTGSSGTWEPIWDAAGNRTSDRNEDWTIECFYSREDNRRQTADALATALKGVQGLRPDRVWVEHSNDQSRVYYGTYRLGYVRAQSDTPTQKKGDLSVVLSEDLKRDLRLIRQLALGSQYPFFAARPMQKPLPDVGPPEWDLRNAKGVYSLHVGITYPTPTMHEYKQAAVDWVKVLREDGYEAYFYHNPDKPETSICVGTFGEDAVATGQFDSQYADLDIEQTQVYRKPVNDLRASNEMFQYNLENGHITYKSFVDPNSGQRERLPNRSFLVRIPRGDSPSRQR